MGFEGREAGHEPASAPVGSRSRAALEVFVDTWVMLSGHNATAKSPPCSFSPRGGPFAST